jgi:hypothetical protein
MVSGNSASIVSSAPMEEREFFIHMKQEKNIVTVEESTRRLQDL